jgi:hypothetical protein
MAKGNIMTEEQIRVAAMMAIQAVSAQATTQGVADAKLIAEHLKTALEYYHEKHPLGEQR